MAASIFFALNPSHARLSGLAYLDVPMIFFGLCAMLATLHLLEKTSLKTLILCGVAHALLLGTKWVQPILFIIPMLVFILLYHRKRISHYISACIIGLLILLVSWFPPIYQLGINLLFLISDHWSNQLHVTERSFLDMILWNVSAAEFALYIACLAVTTILLFSSLKKDGISSIPIISIYTILVMLFAEPRKAVYYWTPITPFTSLLLAQTLYLGLNFYQSNSSKK
jgi:4-amino-4-deoxy-L-arabinose transferase-like glycosyltransferase